MARNKLLQSVLNNKIAREEYIVGKNSILQVIEEVPENIEMIVMPEQYKSLKIEKVKEAAHAKQIQVIFDSKLIRYADTTLNVDSGGVLVLLKKKIDQSISLRTAKSFIEQLDICTVVAVPEVEYEQNLGAIIRTSAALDVDCLLVPHSQQKVFSATVTKVSMGYNFVLPIIKENFLLAITELSKMGFQIIALDMDGENIIDFRYNSKVCFIAGSESGGLSKTVYKKCDAILAIPMSNSVESINVSVSTGIAIYDRVTKIHEIKRAI